MKIKYSILWIDDEPLKSEIERIERYLNDLGFVSDIDKRENAQNEDKINFSKYNLILLDYQLDNSKTIGPILNKIKQKDYYSEVVFYSAKQEFGDYIKEHPDLFEGVFWCDQRGQELYQKTIKVINLTLKKFQDLNNLRGLVMAETSDLDKTKKEIFHKYFKLNHSDQEKIKKSVIGIIEDSLFSNYKKIKKYGGKKIKKVEEIALDEEFSKNIFDLIEDFMFDMDKKGRCIDKIIQVIESKAIFNYKDYKKDILDKRNHLAHSPEEEREGSLFFGSFEFSEEESKNLRKKILKYKKVLGLILEEIDEISKK